MQTFYDKYVRSGSTSTSFTDLGSGLSDSAASSTTSSTSSANSLLGLLDRRVRKSSFDPDAPHRKTAKQVEKQVHEILTGEDRLKAMFDECYAESKARIDAQWNERCTKPALLVGAKKEIQEDVEELVEAAGPGLLQEVGVSPAPSFHSCVSQQMAGEPNDAEGMVRVAARSQSLPATDFESPSQAAGPRVELRYSAHQHQPEFYMHGDSEEATQAEPAQLNEDEEEEADAVRRLIANIDDTLSSTPQPNQSNKPHVTRAEPLFSSAGRNATPRQNLGAPFAAQSCTKSVFSPTPARLAALQTTSPSGGDVYQDENFASPVAARGSSEEPPRVLLSENIVAEHKASPLLLSAAKNKASPFSVRNINSALGQSASKYNMSSSQHQQQQRSGMQQQQQKSSTSKKRGKPTPVKNVLPPAVQNSADPFALDQNAETILFSPRTHDKVHSMMHHSSHAALNADLQFSACWESETQHSGSEPLDRVLSF